MLHEHPGRRQRRHGGDPEPRGQERACACLVLKPDAPELIFEVLQTFLATKGVAKQYWPEKMVVLDDFPKTTSGKIQKFQLRESVGGST